ncbi:hypothetical protein WHR41_01900 [Cladosporium halotolerans]|uniref:Uncharacterized protein n=1 Tax=Cladosporium halotolerans TaxID=1052096 RepID=A0AB34L131_9PEZI
MPLNMSLVQSNYRGVTERMTITAMLFVAYCTGNIAGPHFFRCGEAPHYSTALSTIMICYALMVVLALTLRFYLQWFNAKRSREEGIEGSARLGGMVPDGKLPETVEKNDVAATVADAQLAALDYADFTDWEVVGFRYRM